MERPLIVFHGGCRDGFCAAWVCNTYYKAQGVEPEFFAGYYGQEPPDCTGRDVVIVDFSYKLETMKTIAAQAKSLLVLDHHKTALEDLADFDLYGPANTTVKFDMKRSGARMAHDHFFSGILTPQLVAYVEDRDLWAHKLVLTKEINAYISTIPFDFAAWDAADKESINRWVDKGQAVLAKIAQYVAEVRKNARMVVFEGYEVPCVNASYVDISEVLHSLCDGRPWPFAVGWSQRADGLFQYSLRSVGDFDVSVIAKKYGGGGHRNAAGFESKTLLF